MLAHESGIFKACHLEYDAQNTKTSTKDRIVAAWTYLGMERKAETKQLR